MANQKLWGTYDFSLVSLIVGIQQIKGFADGSDITAERNEDSFTAKWDVDGGATRSRSNNTGGRITFTLSQFSESNKYLSAMANLDERSGAGIVPVKLVDKSNPNNEIVLAPEAWIVKPANKSFGRESGDREWVLECASLNFLDI